MFTAKLIAVAFITVFASTGVLAICDKIGIEIGQKVALIVGLIASVYCIAAGADLVGGWSETLANVDTAEFAKQADKYRRGGTFMLIFTLWPYVLLGIGGYMGYSMLIIYKNRFVR